MNKQDFNNFFASLMTEVGKNKTGSKMLRNVVGSALALAGLEQAAQADIVTTFNYTCNLQTFTVPTTGWYEFTAYGAQGGNGNVHAQQSAGVGALLHGAATPSTFAVYRLRREHGERSTRTAETTTLSQDPPHKNLREARAG